MQPQLIQYCVMKAAYWGERCLLSPEREVTISTMPTKISCLSNVFFMPSKSRAEQDKYKGKVGKKTWEQMSRPWSEQPFL